MSRGPWLHLFRCEITPSYPCFIKAPFHSIYKDRLGERYFAQFPLPYFRQKKYNFRCKFPENDPKQSVGPQNFIAEDAGPCCFLLPETNFHEWNSLKIGSTSQQEISSNPTIQFQVSFKDGKYNMFLRLWNLFQLHIFIVSSLIQTLHFTCRCSS